jgi:glycosyltransferase involved in cell wall biosynthesis
MPAPSTPPKYSVPKYSVVVPAYNSSATIGECLGALARQSISEYEVIVVDDGSTDRTGEIINGFKIADSEGFSLRYIYQPNAGPASARNHGAREAQGDIILFTDADCVPVTTWVQEMAGPFKDPEVSAVKGAYRTSQRSLWARFAQVEFLERFEMLKRAQSTDMVDTYSAAFRRAVFHGAGGFDESFPVANNEDTDLSYKLSTAGHKMLFNPGAIVYHLKHPDSLGKYVRQKFGRGYWRMVVYKRFPGKMLKDTYTPKSLKFQTLAMLATLGSLLLLPLTRLGLVPAALSLGAFIAASVPFTGFALRRDLPVGLLAPLFLAVRGLAIGLGVVYYFLTRLLGKK